MRIRVLAYYIIDIRPLPNFIRRVARLASAHDCCCRPRRRYPAMARLLREERREKFDDRAEERRQVDEQSRTSDARIQRGSALRRARRCIRSHSGDDLHRLVVVSSCCAHLGGYAEATVIACITFDACEIAARRSFPANGSMPDRSFTVTTPTSEPDAAVRARATREFTCACAGRSRGQLDLSAPLGRCANRASALPRRGARACALRAPPSRK